MERKCKNCEFWNFDYMCNNPKSYKYQTFTEGNDCCNEWILKNPYKKKKRVRTKLIGILIDIAGIIFVATICSIAKVSFADSMTIIILILIYLKLEGDKQ